MDAASEVAVRTAVPTNARGAVDARWAEAAACSHDWASSDSADAVMARTAAATERQPETSQRGVNAAPTATWRRATPQGPLA